ncbi:hypothetical protein C0J52_15566 [Blattella germanica]|nr:hypothetical protein C0J52_15566 [Blattella germanica]
MIDNILEFEPVNKRICKIRVKLKFYNLTLIAVHAPTEDKTDQVKEEFYTRLEKICDSVPNYDMMIVLGDFNAQVGKESFLYSICGKFSLHEETNNNGERMVDFTQGWNLVVSGTWYPHKNIHKATWRLPDGKTFNQIDHIMVESRHCSNVLLDTAEKRIGGLGNYNT